MFIFNSYLKAELLQNHSPTSTSSVRMINKNDFYKHVWLEKQSFVETVKLSRSRARKDWDILIEYELKHGWLTRGITNILIKKLHACKLIF